MNEYGLSMEKSNMTWDCSVCGATINSGDSCPECGRDQSGETSTEEMMTDDSGASSGAKVPSSDGGYLPADVWVTIGAGATSLVVGAVGYMITYLQWESVFPFPIITVIAFAYLIQKESGKKAVGTGLYMISALLSLWAGSYWYAMHTANLFGGAIFFGLIMVVSAVLVAIIAAIVGVLLNRSAENASS